MEEGREEVEAFGGKKFKDVGWNAHVDITVTVDSGRGRDGDVREPAPHDVGTRNVGTFYPYAWSTAGVQ